MWLAVGLCPRGAVRFFLVPTQVRLSRVRRSRITHLATLYFNEETPRLLLVDADGFSVMLRTNINAKVVQHTCSYTS